MPVNGMHRRQFFQLAAAAAWLPVATRPCWAALAGLPRHDYQFFDERLERARRIAADWARADRPVGVQGDVTAVWSDGLERMTRERGVSMRGVTTYSFFFCLGVLAGEHCDLRVQSVRIDRDLLHWSLYTTPRSLHG